MNLSPMEMCLNSIKTLKMMYFLENCLSYQKSEILIRISLKGELKGKSVGPSQTLFLKPNLMQSEVPNPFTH